MCLSIFSLLRTVGLLVTLGLFVSLRFRPIRPSHLLLLLLRSIAKRNGGAPLAVPYVVEAGPAGLPAQRARPIACANERDALPSHVRPWSVTGRNQGFRKGFAAASQVTQMRKRLAGYAALWA